MGIMVYWYSTPEDALPRFGTWSARIDWCEKNCKGSWKYKTMGKFQFHDEQDYLMFILRWGR